MRFAPADHIVYALRLQISVLSELGDLMCRRIDISELENIDKLDHLIVQKVLHAQNNDVNIHLRILCDLLDMPAAIYQ